jgi:two-component system phosphate regulon sensor histidine kinase PhoR
MTGIGTKRILIVDDEATVGKSIRHALVREDYEIDVALSGEQALEMQAKKSYDLLIVDLMMPGMSGLDLLKAIKTTSPAAQVIIITGYPTMKATLQAMQTGAFDFLPKPFLPSDLRSLVCRALEGGEKNASGTSG